MNSTLIRNTKVFDGEGFLDGSHDVLLHEGRIRVAPHGQLDAPANAAVVDGTGATLLPGLIDAHVHLSTNAAGSLGAIEEPFSLQFFRTVETMRATLHTGITAVRDAGGVDAGAREAVRSGLVQGPRLSISVTIMSQTGGHGDFMLPSGVTNPLLGEHPGRPLGIADGADDARRVARQILRAGADHIKICTTGGVLSPTDDPRHSQFTPAEIRAIVDEAEEQGRYVLAHAQGTRGIANALEAGVRTIEHGIYLEDETIQMMLDRDAVLVPTLQAPTKVIQAAEAGVALSAGVLEKAKAVVDVHRSSVARAREAGVRIAMGTDAGVGGHGDNLGELELLVDAGMSVAEALRAATSVAATLLPTADLGRIADGSLADAVLVRGDVEVEGLTRLADRIEGVWQAAHRIR